MRSVAFSICVVFFAGCSHAITPSPLPAGPAFRTAVVHAHAFQTLFDFNGPNGERPNTGLIAVKGELYGTASGGKIGPGIVYRIKPSGGQKILHSFGKSSDGSTPGASELAYIKGDLYGVTTYGGKYGGGTVYKITTSGKEKIVYSFKAGFVTPEDGSSPQGGVVAVDGKLYGATSEGGKYDVGIVFEITTSGTEKVLHTFQGGKDGATPFGTLTAVGHMLYGTTRGGGIHSAGTVFAISTSGHEKIIHAFGGSATDGGAPSGGLTLLKGQLYGTTETQGQNAVGTVFSITTSGKERVLHMFSGNPDGANPLYGRLTNVHGTLYGTTTLGGTGYGTIFRITTAGKESIVYSFSAGGSGENPYGSLAFLHGRLYGTTYAGGNSSSLGTAFSLTP